MNSGTAWKIVADPSSHLNGRLARVAGAPLVKHPTVDWPPQTQDAVSVLESPRTSFRRVQRTPRRLPVPWLYLIASVSVLAALILLIVTQHAQLVKYQYELVDLGTQRAGVLQQRDELTLTIQQLSSLERIDSLSHKQLGMVAPIRRHLLDLHASPASTTEPGSLSAANTHEMEVNP